jgi:hypothetical protein
MDDPEALDIPETRNDPMESGNLADEPMRDSRKGKGKEKRKKRSKEGAPNVGGRGFRVKSKIESTKGALKKVDGSGNRAVHGSGGSTGKNSGKGFGNGGSGNGSGNSSGNGSGNDPGNGVGGSGNGFGGNGSGGNGTDGNDDYVDPRLINFDLTDCESFSNVW